MARSSFEPTSLTASDQRVQACSAQRLPYSYGTVVGWTVDVQSGRISTVHMDNDLNGTADDYPTVGSQSAGWDETVRAARNNEDWVTYDVDAQGVITYWAVDQPAPCW